jgi:double zinc ribbon protein
VSSKPPQIRDQAGLRSGLRVAGPVLFGLGLILTLMGLADFFGSFGTFGSGPPRNFWLAFLGLPLMAVGGTLLRVGYLGAASRFLAGEVAPTIKDTIDYVGGGSDQVTCPTCGGTSRAGAKFCDDCGAPLAVSCPSCGHPNAVGASFCDECGKPLTPA